MVGETILANTIYQDEPQPIKISKTDMATPEKFVITTPTIRKMSKASASFAVNITKQIQSLGWEITTPICAYVLDGKIVIERLNLDSAR